MIHHSLCYNYLCAWWWNTYVTKDFNINNTLPICGWSTSIGVSTPLQIWKKNKLKQSVKQIVSLISHILSCKYTLQPPPPPPILKTHFCLLLGPQFERRPQFIQDMILFLTCIQTLRNAARAGPTLKSPPQRNTHKRTKTTPQHRHMEYWYPGAWYWCDFMVLGDVICRNWLDLNGKTVDGNVYKIFHYHLIPRKTQIDLTWMIAQFWKP